jgi:7-cyano-7-deazaguanine synthase
MKSTTILLSGGLDSATALCWARLVGHDVKALAFDYGQRHRKELAAALAIADHYDVPIKLGTLPKLGAITLFTNHSAATIVRGRNQLLISMATATVDGEGGGGIVFGANSDDAAHYPDCSKEFLGTMKEVVRLGTGGRCKLFTPLIKLTKGEVLKFALRHSVPVELTWSCYKGGPAPCGTCGACQDRNRAEEYVQSQ